MKSTLIKGALAAVVATGAVLATTAPASAEIACNRWHECWHTRDHLAYPARAGVVYHDDAWRHGHMHGWHWRADRADHGYYRNGVWITF